MTVKVTANESVKKSASKLYRLMPEHQNRPHCCEGVMFSGAEAVATSADLSGFVGILLAEVDSPKPVQAKPVSEKKVAKKKAAKKTSKKASEDSEG